MTMHGNPLTKRTVACLVALMILLSCASVGLAEQTGPSWTWDTSDFDIGEWYIGVPGTDIVYDPVSKAVDAEIYARTGLKKISYTTSPSGADERLTAMIAADMLPDLITVQFGSSQEIVNMLQSGGMVEDLLPLIDQYAPTMMNELNPDMIEWWKTDEGKWFAFPSNTYSGREERPMGRDVSAFCFARKDIMEQLDIKPEDFKTQDGFVDALKKFQASGITNDGKEMYPLIMGELSEIDDRVEYLSGFFGMMLEDADGNYLTPQQTSAYWEMMGFLNRLYREGFLTEQNLLMKTAEAREIAAQSNFFLNFGTNSTMGQVKAATKASNGEIYYIATEPPRSSNGDDPLFVSGGVSSVWCVTFISAKAQNKDRIIRFLDFLNSREGNMLMFHGIEGVHYEMVEKFVPQTGQVQMVRKTNPDYENELNADKAATKKKYGTQEMFMIYDLRFLQSNGFQKDYEDKSIEDQMETDIWDFNGNKGQGSSRHVILNDCVSTSAVSPDPDSDAADIKAKINIYMQEQRMKLITAASAEEFEKLHAETMDKLNAMGLETLQAVQNEKFQAVKAKFGLEYSYPQLAK